MNQFTLHELGNDEHFDPLTVYDSVPFTQAKFYGDWQRTIGRVVKRFLIENNSETVGYIQLIKYPLPFGKSYFYAPYGPVIKKGAVSLELLSFLKTELRSVASTNDTVFVRLDFTPQINKDFVGKIFTASHLYTYHSAYFQPRNEWFLELDKPEDEILDAMHEKTRYSVRLAIRRDVQVEIVTENFKNYFNDFYALMKETAQRNKFSLHPKNYYEVVFDSLSGINGSFLSVARYDQKVLAIDMIVVFGKTANYVFGGSSTESRNRVPTYLAQWRAICHAKKIGCMNYNFGGISVGDGTYKGWEGLTAFKKKFGGFQVDRSPLYDTVSIQFWYHMYNFRKLIKKITHY